MSAIVVTGRFNAPLLSEELVAAIPQLIDRTVDPAEARFSMSYDGGVLTFNARVRFDEAVFRSVITAHNPNGKSKNERRADRRVVLTESIRLKLGLAGFTEEEVGLLLEFLEDAASASRRA